MDEIEIPQYFICPISLQIMKDPVTATTGITYDRESIEYWLSTAEDATCPVTKQPLPRDSDLTQNHTLRRLIQGWCTTNANHGIDRIPTPKPSLGWSQVFKLNRGLNVPDRYVESLTTMDLLASENEKNRKCMAEAGSAKALILVIIKCFKEGRTTGLDRAIRILYLIWRPLPENIHFVKDNFDLIQALTWVLQRDYENRVEVKTHAVLVLKMIIEIVSSSLLERLNPNFFRHIVNVLRENMSKQATKAALHVLIETCPWGRSRIKIVEEGAVLELIELELVNPEKHITELIFCLLAQLCSCADGRAQLVSHAGGIALVAARTLRVSPATDDQVLQILAAIAKFSATNTVLSEMLRIGAVAKLCMVLQADCAANLKRKARAILRLHYGVWNNSPCLEMKKLNVF